MFSLALLLFLVMDPFGNVVTLNTLLAAQPPKKRQLIILRESLIATGILLAAMFSGNVLLRILGLQGHALSISGGIVLFLIALGMLFPSRRIIDNSAEESPMIVPIAMPLIAGPSAISIVILFSEKYPMPTVAAGVLLACLGSTVLLSVSPLVFRFLGRRGALALERLVGMLLVMLSVQMILDGIDAYIKSRGI